MASNKLEMQVYLDTMKTQQKLYGYPTEDLEQLSKQLDQATDLQEFLKAIKPRTDPTALGTILLVQGGDDPEHSMNARGLRSHGYNVIEASGGIEAMVTLEDGAVDLVVSNVHSEFIGVRASDGTACRTILDGPALLKGFRRLNSNLKIIFVCSNAEEKSLPPENEQFAILRKPFTLDQLVAAVGKTMAPS